LDFGLWTRKEMKRVILTIALTLSAFGAAAAQVTVSPTETTVYSQGATSVFLTFGGLVNRRPAEATWCGEIIPAVPDLGFKCDPQTIFGQLPARYDQSRLSGNKAYTDIMSVTPAVARRAYLDAAAGNTGSFFYVRRFASTIGAVDEYVPVTIRLAGNGAAVPFSLANIRLLWDDGRKTVPFVKSTEKLPTIKAEIHYTGTGRLVGRWEIMKPGEQLPDQRDLLTEATLPAEQRGTQRRFTQVSRFNVFLPPGGRFDLPGPENWRIDKTVAGMYLLLLRIEAVTDGQNKSDLPAIGAGAAVVNSGGAAGFPMPVLRYYVSAGGQVTQVDSSETEASGQLLPANDTEIAATESIAFRWPTVENAQLYRLEISDLQSHPVLSAVLRSEARNYRAPSWLREQVGGKTLQWQVIAFGADGKVLNETPRFLLRFAK
jgi:hypothetical protein